MLESGRYRFSAVSEYFGQTKQALHTRMLRDDELGRRYRQAKAKGEMRQCDRADGVKGEEQADRESARWFLERIHGVQKPLDRERSREARASLRALRAAERAATSKPVESDVAIWRDMMRAIPGRIAPEVAEGEKA